jgi:Pentapeptide repeats (9 copies)
MLDLAWRCKISHTAADADSELSQGRTSYRLFSRMMTDDLADKIWDRLLRGRSLDDLQLARHEGRFDLRRLGRPRRTSKWFGFGTTELPSGVPLRIQGASWRDLDFSGAVLEELRLFRMKVINCKFDECRLPGLRVWSSSFADCTFVKANLRNCMLGGVEDTLRTKYLRVDFSRADIRSTSYEAAAFEGCAFRSTQLSGVDFESSTFKDCVFEGEIRDVVFWRHGFEGERHPPNQMINVNFRRAQLHAVSFRGLTMDKVMFPEDKDHVVIDDCPAVLERLVSILLKQGDKTARSLVFYLEMDREWLPPRARRVVNLQDLNEFGGREVVDLFVELQREHPAQQ